MLWIHYLLGVCHFAKCCTNQAVTMRNANKSLKTPYFTLVRKMKIDPESVSWTGAPSKVSQFFQLVDPIIKPTFNEIDSLLFQ